MDISRIPTYILSNLHERGHTDEQIATMTPEEALDEFLNWEGIIGYTGRIVGALDALRAAETKKSSAFKRFLLMEEVNDKRSFAGFFHTEADAGKHVEVIRRQRKETFGGLIDVSGLTFGPFRLFEFDPNKPTKEWPA